MEGSQERDHAVMVKDGEQRGTSAFDDADDRLTWRMDAEQSHSDWTIEIYVDQKLHGTYHVHKNILAVGPKKSEYFASLFRSSKRSYAESKVKTSRIEELHELAAHAFPIALDYLYSFTDDLKITNENAAALYHLGMYFGIESLWAKARCFWEKEMVIDQCGTYYTHAKIFGIDELVKAIVKYCCKDLDSIEPSSQLVKVADAQLWLGILEEQGGKPQANLCDLIADFCNRTRDAELFLLMTSNESLPQISAAKAFQFLELEQSLIPSSASPLAELSDLQIRCVKALASHWPSLDTSRAFASLAKLDPLVLASVLKQTIGLAKDSLFPKKIIVSGAGTTAVNGIYVRCDDCVNGLSPEFVMAEGRWKGQTVNFALYCCQLSTMEWNWFISILDEDSPYSNRDIDFYCSKSIDTKTPVPPVTGWVVIKQKGATHGVGPAPTFDF